MSDDFFRDLDNQLSAATTAKATATQQKDAARTFSEQAIVEIQPIAREYAAKLRERNISANRSGGENTLVFEMAWANGDQHKLTVVPDLDTGRLKFHYTSTDHTTGKPFSSTGATLYGPDNWSMPVFQDELQKFISDYVRLAEKHGGIA